MQVRRITLPTTNVILVQGQAVGSAAHLVALRREGIGEFSVDDAWDMDTLVSAMAESYTAAGVDYTAAANVTRPFYGKLKGRNNEWPKEPAEPEVETPPATDVPATHVSAPAAIASAAEAAENGGSAGDR